MKKHLLRFKNWFKTKGEEKQKLTKNPYLNARRTWNSHTAGLMKSLQIWQLVCLASLLITLTAVGGLIHLGSQSKFIPLVFQQDARGNTLSISRAEKVGEATLDDYRAAAVRFIEHSRMVTADVELQKKAILTVYSYLNGHDAAVAKANQFFNGNTEVNPFNRAMHELVSAEIVSVLQESTNTWQVAWIETTRHRDGSLKEAPQAMKALITLYQNKELSDISPDTVLKNPHFIFVRDFNWSKDLQPAGANL